MGETTPLATTERHFSGPRLTRAREWLGNLGNGVASQESAASLLDAVAHGGNPQKSAASLFQAPRFIDGVTDNC